MLPLLPFLKEGPCPHHNRRETLSNALWSLGIPQSHWTCVWNFCTDSELYNTWIATMKEEFRKGGKNLSGRKKRFHANLPSTRSWLTCHNIAAILWSCPMLSLPLCCQQPSSDAAQWKIRHLIKKTSAVPCWATCRPILITLHHGKSSFISKNSNLTDIKTRIRLVSFFFFFVWRDWWN